VVALAKRDVVEVVDGFVVKVLRSCFFNCLRCCFRGVGNNELEEVCIVVVVELIALGEVKASQCEIARRRMPMVECFMVSMCMCVMCVFQRQDALKFLEAQVME